MENNNKQNNPLKKTEPTDTLLFNEDEIDTTVRKFVLAWLHGNVKINFTSPALLVAEAKLRGEKLDYATATMQSINAKMQFVNQIQIVSGKLQATPQQRKETILELFKWLLVFRCGDRISGSFIDMTDIENRITRVEERLEDMNSTIEQLVIWYRSLLGNGR